MNQHVPEPVCKGFLVCGWAGTDPQTGESKLLCLPMAYRHQHFPCPAMLGFCARLSDARGDYEVEVQLVNSAGEVVWRDGPPGSLTMDDPLMYLRHVA